MQAYEDSPRSSICWCTLVRLLYVYVLPHRASFIYQIYTKHDVLSPPCLVTKACSSLRVLAVRVSKTLGSFTNHARPPPAAPAGGQHPPIRLRCLEGKPSQPRQNYKRRRHANPRHQQLGRPAAERPAPTASASAATRHDTTRPHQIDSGAAAHRCRCCCLRKHMLMPP